MDQDNQVSPVRIELRQHRRCLVSNTCLLSFAPFAPTLSFDGDVEGEGVVLNLSPGGCKIGSEAGVKVGDAMSLIILLPGETCPTAVDLALVRWGKGLYFGVEFVSMGNVEQDRLRQFLASAPAVE
ncbi:MAG: PilZ domain-containing protein [Nitrospira sp.]|nr:MAG: PilZ domain-containing protein [Nitrospira sp.]